MNTFIWFEPLDHEASQEDHPHWTNNNHIKKIWHVVLTKIHVAQHSQISMLDHERNPENHSHWTKNTYTKRIWYHIFIKNHKTLDLLTISLICCSTFNFSFKVWLLPYICYTTRTQNLRVVCVSSMWSRNFIFGNDLVFYIFSRPFCPSDPFSYRFSSLTSNIHMQIWVKGHIFEEREVARKKS